MSGTLNIIYKMEEFPINIEKFKRNSKYFDKPGAIDNDYVMLPEPYGDDVPITKPILETFLFISQCKMSEFTEEELNEKCHIQIDNVIQLNFLSNAFQVPYLIDKTLNFMKENQDEVLKIIFKINPVNWNFELEQFIVSILHTILDDERLFVLPISILHRMIERFMKKNGLHFVKDIIDFFFKCLEHYGIDASPLCRLIPVSIYEDQFLDTLIFEYKDLFDFCFMNGEHIIYMANKLQRLQVELLQVKLTHFNESPQ